MRRSWPQMPIRKAHRDQHHFPEQEEEEEVERKENADDADFQHQQHDEKFFHAVLDALPRRQNRNRRQKRRQNDQKQADAVDAEVIVDGLAALIQCGRDLPLTKPGVGSTAPEGRPEAAQATEGIRRAKLREPSGESICDRRRAAAAAPARPRAGKKIRTVSKWPPASISAPSRGLASPRGQKNITAITTSAPMTTHTA